MAAVDGASQLLRRFRATAPDYVEHHATRCLLVWRDLAYWMVVDDEFHALLGALDGAKTWGELRRDHPEWAGAEQALLGQIHQLQAAGVVQEESDPQREPVVPSLPLIENVSVHITRRCNLRCRFCYAQSYLNSPTAGAEVLRAEEITAFLDSIRAQLSPQFTLTLMGGEPLLDAAKVMHLARYARQRAWACLVSTNGLLITESLAWEARNTGLQVQVSLDGATAEAHDAVRGAGTFDRTLGGIRRLVSAGAHTTLSLVCHRGNVEHLRAYYKLGLRLGVNGVRFIPLKLLGAARGGSLEPVTLPELLGRARELFRSHPEFRTLAGRDCFSILASTCRFSARRPSCGTGLQTFLLDADGTIFPCLNLCAAEWKLANIRDRGFDFAVFWRSAAALARLRVETAVAAEPNGCARCVVRHWCLGGCHGGNAHRDRATAWSGVELCGSETGGPGDVLDAC